MLGTQANVWTEVMEDHARVDYQTFPGLAAFAEVAWSALPAPADRQQRPGVLGRPVEGPPPNR